MYARVILCCQLRWRGSFLRHPARENTYVRGVELVMHGWAQSAGYAPHRAGHALRQIQSNTLITITLEFGLLVRCFSKIQVLLSETPCTYEIQANHRVMGSCLSIDKFYIIDGECGAYIQNTVERSKNRTSGPTTHPIKTSKRLAGKKTAIPACAYSRRAIFCILRFCMLVTQL
jgi:hypothetical protein